MRFLVNENVPGSVIRRLRASGHDVISARESMRGQSDLSLLQRSIAEDRLIVSQDKDFAELVFKLKMPADCGVVLFRLAGTSPASDESRMIEVLSSNLPLRQHFTVVTDTTIRTRRIPPEKAEP